MAFLTGADVAIPASPDASGTISSVSVPRDGAGLVQRITTPDWPSAGHRITVLFRDDVQRVETPRDWFAHLVGRR